MEEDYEEPKFDSRVLGAILGIAAPLFTFWAYYFWNSRGMPFRRFLDNLQMGKIFLPLLSLCVVPNLLIFFIFIWTRKENSAKGVILATILFALYVAAMKIF